MARRSVLHVDTRPPLEYADAVGAWRKVIREQGVPMLEMDPNDYETVGTVRRREGRRVCLTCGGAQFIRFTWPMGHPYFGRSVRCPECNDD